MGVWTGSEVLARQTQDLCPGLRVACLGTVGTGVPVLILGVLVVQRKHLDRVQERIQLPLQRLQLRPVLLGVRSDSPQATDNSAVHFPVRPPAAGLHYPGRTGVLLDPACPTVPIQSLHAEYPGNSLSAGFYRHSVYGPLLSQWCTCRSDAVLLLCRDFACEPVFPAILVSQGCSCILPGTLQKHIVLQKVLCGSG